MVQRESKVGATMKRTHWMCEAMSAAGESPGISPEPEQAQRRSPPATPSAAVGADGPGAGDTVPRTEYDRLIELLYQIGDLAHDASAGPERPDTCWDIRQMAYGFREHAEWVPSDTEESDWKHSQKIRKDAKEYSENTTADYPVPSDSKPTNCHNPESEDTPPHKPVMGPVVGTATVKYHEPSPSPPAESPDDWVMITDPNHIPRVGIDYFEMDDNRWMRMEDYHTKETVGEYAKVTGGHRHRCRRKDLPPVPAESPALPSPWRPMSEKPRVASKHWLAWDGKQMSVTMNTGCSGWPVSGAIAWMPVDALPHPNAAPADKPRMRQVTLKSYKMHGDVVWTSASWIRGGRTAVVEVPE